MITPEMLAAQLADVSRPVVLIDGRSGAGKTTWATRLVAAWPGEAPQLVNMDDLYPGWDGLAAGSAVIATDVLHPAHPGYRRWDWHRNAPAEWVSLDPHRPLVVEGSGALTVANRALATTGVWLESDLASRKDRALTRDGDIFAPHWERWAAQEEEHCRLHSPWELAEYLVRV